jgi:hypothetical protein
MDKYDHPRVWLLAAFCVAAHKDMPDGVKWASLVGGWVRPPVTVDEAAALIFSYKSPLYSALRGSRIKVSHDTQTNRIMTGLRVSVEPFSMFHLQETERDCIRDLRDFIRPTVFQLLPYGRENITMLLEALLKEDAVLAA